MRKRVVTKETLRRDTKRNLREMEQYKVDIDHWNDTRGHERRIECDLDVDAWIGYLRACLIAIDQNVDGPIDFPAAPASCSVDVLLGSLK